MTTSPHAPDSSRYSAAAREGLRAVCARAHALTPLYLTGRTLHTSTCALVRTYESTALSLPDLVKTAARRDVTVCWNGCRTHDGPGDDLLDALHEAMNLERMTRIVATYAAGLNATNPLAAQPRLVMGSTAVHVAEQLRDPIRPDRFALGLDALRADLAAAATSITCDPHLPRTVLVVATRMQPRALNVQLDLGAVHAPNRAGRLCLVNTTVGDAAAAAGLSTVPLDSPPSPQVIALLQREWQPSTSLRDLLASIEAALT